MADRRRRRQETKREKGPPRWQTALSKGTARTTFVVGALLTLPGASYLIGLNHIADQNASTVGTIALVLSFNLIMLMLLELPLIGYAVAPEWTPRTVDRFQGLVQQQPQEARLPAGGRGWAAADRARGHRTALTRHPSAPGQVRSDRLTRRPSSPRPRPRRHQGADQPEHREDDSAGQSLRA